MTQKIQVSLVCDRCPAEQETQAAGTLVFRYNGADYETDLCAPHMADAEKTFTVLAGRARRVSAIHKPKRDRTSEQSRFRSDARAWAMENGRPVNAMGRVPASVLRDYREYLQRT